MNNNIHGRASEEAALQSKIILSIVLFATITRIAIPGHIPNFSPIDAIALFCGAYFPRRLIAIFVALLSVWVGDLLINKISMGHWVLFYQGFYWQYGCYLLITLLGTTLVNKVKPLHVVSACFASAILFFVISNFGVWYSGLLYPRNIDGFIACFVAAIPFFKNTLLSDLFFSTVLFGSAEWIQTKSLVKSI